MNSMMVLYRAAAGDYRADLARHAAWSCTLDRLFRLVAGRRAPSMPSALIAVKSLRNGARP
ncbi:MAG: hypothetical protein GC150_07705 [Rhizobiales bacterium]|nr:hypothetical protein [Hyphomicrobiales bacterium]